MRFARCPWGNNEQLSWSGGVRTVQQGQPVGFARAACVSKGGGDFGVSEGKKLTKC